MRRLQMKREKGEKEIREKRGGGREDGRGGRNGDKKKEKE